MPLFKPTKFYSRQQGSTTFNFYVSKDKQLIAEAVRDGKIRQLQIDIPRNFQTDLDEEKRSKLRTMFDQCYFGVQGDKILVNVRGLGGWGYKQHKGYRDDATPGSIHYFINKAGEGVFIWKRDIEAMLARFPFNAARGRHPAYNASSGIAIKVANACDSVDYGDTRPETHLNRDAQSWHFNTNACRGGMEDDSRIQLAVNCLMGSIKPSNVNWELLGRGLHPLQDVFAHTDAFVQSYTRTGQQSFYGHVDLDNPANSGNADSPTYINPDCCSFLSAIQEERQLELSQRYSDTKTITYIYFYIHHLLTGGERNQQVEDLINSRIRASLDSANFGGSGNLSNRGTHGICNFVLAIYHKIDQFPVQNAAYIQNVIRYIDERLRAALLQKFESIQLTIPPVRETPVDEARFGFAMNIWVKAYGISKADATDGETNYSSLITPQPQ